ncbi:hypothetical protein C0Q70_18947 [Pomacea canaliculata]|uniref:Peptidase S1 domain-containing protein n=1 Tax=Pomacea canaliculata TaxID=400727 RepID=A0A2T7NI05_POMCA|nr:hypothetical protein C0Q70_18947 [Pomacea canaliculata]
MSSVQERLCPTCLLPAIYWIFMPSRPPPPCGTALLAQTAYATLKCTTNSSQPLPPAPTSTTITTTTSTTTRPTTTTTAKPTTTTKPPTTKTTSTTTAKPTTTSTTTSTSTTTTTAAPTTASIQNCGASTVASRLASVSSSDFVLSSRIVGGVPVGSCQAIPWQVRLSIDGNELCGASIIDQTHLLTAAHCVPAGAKIEAVAGEYDLFRKESSEQSVQVSKATVHPGYTTLANGALMNDVAVLTLATPLNFSNPCIAPVCLSPTYTVAAGGQKCTVSGWGTTSYQGSVSTQLQSVSIETHQGSECASTFGFSTLTNYVPSPSTQLCAGDPVNGGKDSCQGDSGGPLTCQTASGSYVQVGVVSYGNGCATAQYPGIYTSVSAYYDWIQQQL